MTRHDGHRRERSAWAWIPAVLLGGVLLAACGGGGGGSDGPSHPDWTELEGTMSTGLAEDGNAFQVTVRGRVGRARTSESPVAGGQRFRVALKGLDGPYLVSRDTRLFSLAGEAGPVSLTPLSTLATAWLIRTDPVALVSQLSGGLDGGNVSVEAPTARAVAEAQRQARRYLRGRLGVEFAAPEGDWLTLAFEPVAGDPVQDALAALQTSLGAMGLDVASVASLIGAQAARCANDAVSVLRDGQDPGVDFCRARRTTTTDPAAPGVTVYRFVEGLDGDTLAWRVRGRTLLSIEYVGAADGSVQRCDGDGCAGASVGAASGDGSRALGLRGTVLRGADGSSRTLRGTLHTLPPGTLDCADGYFVAPPGSAVGDAAEVGLCVSASVGSRGLNRQWHTFSNVEAAPAWQLVLESEGRRVRSLTLLQADPLTGLSSVAGQCRDAGCQGARLGALDAAGARALRLDAVVLPGRNADGSLDGRPGVQLRGRLQTAAFVPSTVGPLCTLGQDHVAAQPSDEAAPIDFCPPDDDRSQGFSVRGRQDLGDGTVLYLASSLYGDASSFGSGDVLNLVLDADGAVVSLGWVRVDGESFECRGAACGGITFEPAGAGGLRPLRLTATRLAEIGPGGLPGERTLQLDGTVRLPGP